MVVKVNCIYADKNSKCCIRPKILGLLKVICIEIFSNKHCSFHKLRPRPRLPMKSGTPIQIKGIF